MGLTVALSVVIALLAFVVLPYGLSQMLSSRISSFAVLGLIEGLIRIVLFVGYVIAISYMRDINRTFCIMVQNTKQSIVLKMVWN